jgi:hexokinase
VELDGRGTASITAASRFVIPEVIMRDAGERLFDFLAECLAFFFNDHPVARLQEEVLAFAFSFPVEQCSVDSGTLIAWTKGFTVSGVEGRDVAALLFEAMKRKGLGFVRVAALTNDTVGALMAGCYADPSCDMGVILGTGTNACYPERIARIAKHSGWVASEEMIVNLEWGNFDRLQTNRYDEMLDNASPNAGRQRLEKMASGLYLGEIARLVIVEMIEKGLLLAKQNLQFFSEAYALNAEHLSIAANGLEFFDHFGITNVSVTDRQIIRKIGRLVADRSARIAGAVISAVLTWMDAGLEENHAVVIDGSLFEKNPRYQAQIKKLLCDLFGDRARGIKLFLVKDGSGIGAAIAGATAVLTDRS